MPFTVNCMLDCPAASQTSPTTPQGYKSNTQPRGSYLPPLNPIEATLGVTNASFVAQTATQNRARAGDASKLIHSYLHLLCA